MNPIQLSLGGKCGKGADGRENESVLGGKKFWRENSIKAGSGTANLRIGGKYRYQLKKGVEGKKEERGQTRFTGELRGMFLERRSGKKIQRGGKAEKEFEDPGKTTEARLKF